MPYGRGSKGRSEVQCPTCYAWVPSRSERETPRHKKDPEDKFWCPGSTQRPASTKGF